MHKILFSCGHLVSRSGEAILATDLGPCDLCCSSHDERSASDGMEEVSECQDRCRPWVSTSLEG